MLRIKEILKCFIPDVFLDWRIVRNKKKLVDQWVNTGCSIPPPHVVKQMTIREYQEKYKCNIFVETGTFQGEMINAQKKIFKTLFSIELGVDLYKNAVERFKKDKHVTLLQGDSGKVLSQVMQNIDEPAIFWLDGHYSAGITARGDVDYPIFQELDIIFESKPLDHILLIDDARLFTGKEGAPKLENIIEHIKKKNQKYQIDIQHDIIRCVIEER